MPTTSHDDDALGANFMPDHERDQAYELADQLRTKITWGLTPQGETYWKEVYQALAALALPAPPMPLEVVSQADRMVALSVRAWDRDVDTQTDFTVGPIVVSNSRGRSCRMTPQQARDMAAKLVELADWTEGQ